MTRYPQSGTSLLELLVALAILGLGLGVMLANLEPVEQPVDVGVRLVEGYVLQARSTAIATTSVQRVTVDAADRLVTDSGADCGGATWERVDSLELPDQVEIVESGWSVCFSRRGISNANAVLTVAHPDHDSRQVEVLLGGLTRVN